MFNNIYFVGFGLVYVYGVLDSGYRYDFFVEEVIDFGRRSIYYVIYRDVYSGGVVNCKCNFNFVYCKNYNISVIQVMIVIKSVYMYI